MSWTRTIQAFTTYEQRAITTVMRAMRRVMPPSSWPGPAVWLAGTLFFVGILLFSGSLYLLSLTGARWLGAVTPFGGTAWLLGWAALA